VKLLAYALAACLLISCAPAQLYYNNNAEKNLSINVKTDDRSGIFTSVEFAVGIYDYDSQCQSKFDGIVELNEGKNNIGLKPDTTSFAFIAVSHKSHYRHAATGRGFLIKPKPGKRYEADFTYLDKMLDLRLYEVHNSQRKELKIKTKPMCASS